MINILDALTFITHNSDKINTLLDIALKILALSGIIYAFSAYRKINEINKSIIDIHRNKSTIKEKVEYEMVCNSNDIYNIGFGFNDSKNFDKRVMELENEYNNKIKDLELQKESILDLPLLRIFSQSNSK